MGEYRIVEHTADVGIYAVGRSLEDLFAQATLGLLEITGTWVPGEPAEVVPVAIEAHDLGAMLVDWLSEVLYLQDAGDAVIRTLEVSKVDPPRANGLVGITPRGEDDIEGTPVKAITYHQLQVEETEGEGWECHVFFDI